MSNVLEAVEMLELAVKDVTEACAKLPATPEGRDARAVVEDIKVRLPLLRAFATAARVALNKAPSAETRPSKKG